MTPKHAVLWRRLAAICYDSLLLIALLILATAAVLPLTGGLAVPSGNAIYQLYLLALSFVFFCWCWTHGGQTLGMRAWRIKLQSVGGREVGWGQASLRFVCAAVSWSALGLGYVWSLLDGNRMAWHDHWSRTIVVMVTKENEAAL